MQIGIDSFKLNRSSVDMADANRAGKSGLPSAAKPADIASPKKKPAPPRKKSKKPKDMVSYCGERFGMFKSRRTTARLVLLLRMEVPGYMSGAHN